MIFNARFGRHFVMCCSLLLVQSHLVAQVVLKGHVKSTEGTEVAFARLGIIGTSIQAISDEKGFFSISIPESRAKGLLTFQAPGMRSVSFPVHELSARPDLIVTLESAVQQLEDHVVTNKSRLKKKTRGNSGLVSGYRRRSVYAQYMVRINPPKDKAVYVSKIRFHVNNSEETNFKVRPLIFLADEDQQVTGENLVKANETFEFTAKKGWLELDISHLNIEVAQGPFYIGVEWVNITGQNDSGSSISLLSPAGAPSFQSVQFGVWKEIKGPGGFGIKAILEYF